jgi:DNA invertase Pin-like site-specific DNA recombinase
MDRPILNAIMERIRRGESKGIVVYRLDRFARTLIGGYTALSELVEHGGEFASASEPQFDLTMPQGRLFLQLSLGMAEYFRELNKENWETAARSAVERGVHVAPHGAFGYDRGVDGRFTPNEDAPFLQEAAAQNRRRQDQARGHALVEATPLPPSLQPVHKDAPDNIEASNGFAQRSHTGGTAVHVVCPGVCPGVLLCGGRRVVAPGDA